MIFNKRPKFSLQDSDNTDKIKKILTWFLRNDSQVRIVTLPTLQALYHQGIIPRSGSQNDPRDHYSDISNLTEWFIYKMALNIQFIKDLDKRELLQLLDIYSEGTSESLKTIGVIASKYELDVSNLTLSEIDKIVGDDHLTFKLNYMDDCIQSAELRVMAWIYYCSFGSQYKDDSVES